MPRADRAVRPLQRQPQAAQQHAGKIAERRAQLEQQMLDIHQMQLELDTAQERCEQALAATLNNKDNR